MSDAWDDDTPDAWSKVRENKARRAAERQGYALHRNRRRDPRALGYGTYSLSSRHALTASAAAPQSANLHEVESFLKIKDSEDAEENQDS